MCSFLKNYNACIVYIANDSLLEKKNISVHMICILYLFKGNATQIDLSHQLSYPKFASSISYTITEKYKNEYPADLNNNL